jgi:hypothetical protein
MVAYGDSLATRGILNNNNAVTLVTAGVIILEFGEVPVRKRRGGFVGPERPPLSGQEIKKLIKVSFIFNGIIYKYIKVVEKNIKIRLDDIEIINENNVPKINFKIVE